MDIDTIFSEVRAIIAAQMQVDAKDVDLTTNLARDVGINDLDAMDIALDLEKAFTITISDEEVSRFNTKNSTVKTLCTIVQGKLRVKFEKI